MRACVRAYVFFCVLLDCMTDVAAARYQHWLASKANIWSYRADEEPAHAGMTASKRIAVVEEKDEDGPAAPEAEADGCFKLDDKSAGRCVNAAAVAVWLLMEEVACEAAGIALAVVRRCVYVYVTLHAWRRCHACRYQKKHMVTAFQSADPVHFAKVCGVRECFSV